MPKVRAVLLLFFCLLIFGQKVAYAQSYPTKTVKIVTAEIGGGPDIIARILAEGLKAQLGQPVIIENHAAGPIPMDIVAKAAPDGYTLLVTSNSTWILPLMQPAPYDPVHDFKPVTVLGTAPYVLVVHPSVAANSVQELIALAKSKPGQLNFATAEPGSAIELAADLFKAMTDVDVTPVPYRGGGPAVTALLKGEIQFMFAAASAAKSNIEAGSLRGLAVTSTKQSQVFPGLPTVAATVPGYKSVGIYGLFAPAGTDAAIIDKLNAASARVLNDPKTKQKLAALGVQAAPNSPDEFSKLIASEMTRLGAGRQRIRRTLKALLVLSAQ